MWHGRKGARVVEITAPQVGRCRHARPRATERDIKRSEVGGNSTRTGGGDDRWLGLLEKPLDCLAVGLVAELSCELENPCGARGGHADPAASAVDFCVPVFGGVALGGWLGGTVALGWLGR